MQYLYHSQAGQAQLEIVSELHRYLFKVRRHREDEIVHLRNLDDGILYEYRIENMDKKRALLQKIDQRELCIEAKRQLHIGWCIVDPKSVEKILPTLNEIGVEKITFIYCKRSQKSFKVDLDRLKKILLNSSQQSGRSKMMDLDEVDSLAHFLELNPDSWMLNFSDQMLDTCKQEIKTIVIGAEGGFVDDEQLLVDAKRVVGLDSPLILRSESAACVAAGIILL